MARPRKVQPMAVPVEPSQPVLPMRILVPKILRGGRPVYEGQIVNATEQERKTWLFWRMAEDA